jgi:hypothetical protein
MVKVIWIHQSGKTVGVEKRKTINVVQQKRKKERTRELKDRLIGEAKHEK